MQFQEVVRYELVLVLISDTRQCLNGLNYTHDKNIFKTLQHFKNIWAYARVLEESKKNGENWWNKKKAQVDILGRENQNQKQDIVCKSGSIYLLLEYWAIFPLGGLTIHLSIGNGPLNFF